MADLSNHVLLAIAVDTVGLARAGFGVPLYLSPYASTVFASGELTREYSSLAAVAEDFPVTTSPEYLVASAVFSQNPKVTKLKIGAQSLKPSISYVFTPVVRNSHTYTLTVGGKGFATTQISYTSDANATATEICDGLRTALAALTGENCTGSGTTTLIITATTAGDWFYVETDEIADWSTNGCTHADPGVATDLAAIALYDNDWYCLLGSDPGNASILALTAWVQANKKICLPEVAELQARTTAITNSDTLDDLHTLGYSRTAGVYSHKPGAFYSGAWASSRLWTKPGAESWKFVSPVGVTAAPKVTGTHRTNLVNRKANFAETLGAKVVMSEGTTSDGNFIDVIRGIDWLDDDMTKAVLEVMLKAAAQGGKIPFTDDGIAVIVGAVRGSLRRAVAAGILAKSPAPTVTAPLVADISPADKAARKLPDVKFTGTLAGAIHKTEIDGVVTV
jgi:hypothetical protein